MRRTYIAIDLKSYYASVECMERGLDPMTTNLVVADLSRTALAHGIAELHLQAWGATTADMLRCGQELAALAPGLTSSPLDPARRRQTARLSSRPSHREPARLRVAKIAPVCRPGGLRMA